MTSLRKAVLVVLPLILVACGGGAAPGPSTPVAPAASKGARLTKPLEEASKDDLSKAVASLDGWELKSASESGDDKAKIVTVLATKESPFGEASPSGKKYLRLVVTHYKMADKARLDSQARSASPSAACAMEGPAFVQVEIEGRPKADASAAFSELFGAR
jgi:hypothetical protein